MSDTSKSRILPWLMLSLIWGIVFGAFSFEIRGDFANRGLLGLFPLFGLLAWATMWTHYAEGTLRLSYGYSKNKLFSKLTGVIVLFLIIAHPAILVYEMYRNTMLLPPESIVAYVADGAMWSVIIAEVALIIFLSYEVADRLKSKAWIKKNWFIISLSQALAMTLIFVHSLVLGRNLQEGWFSVVWIAMGALLIPCFGVIFRNDWQKRANNQDIA